MNIKQVEILARDGCKPSFLNFSATKYSLGL